MRNDIDILLNAEDNAAEPINRVKGHLDNLGQSIVTIGAAYLTWETAKSAFKWAIDGAIESERATNHLKNTVENAGYSWKNTREQIDDTTQSLVDMTAYGDEELYGVMEGLIRITGDYQGSLKNMGLAANVASGFNIDLSTATSYVGRAMIDGEVNIGRVTYSLEDLRKKSAGMAAAELNTFEGKVKDIRDRLGEVGEIIGKKFLDHFSDDLDNVADDAKRAAENIDGLLTVLEKVWAAAMLVPRKMGEGSMVPVPQGYSSWEDWEKRITTAARFAEMGMLPAHGPESGPANEVYGPTKAQLLGMEDANQETINVLMDAWAIYYANLKIIQIQAVGSTKESLDAQVDATFASEQQSIDFVAGSWQTRLDALPANIQLGEDQLAKLGTISKESLDELKGLGEDYTMSMLANDDYLFNADRSMVDKLIREKARLLVALGQLDKKGAEDFIAYEKQKVEFKEQTDQIFQRGSRAVAANLVDAMSGGHLRLKEIFGQIAKDFAMMIIQRITDALAAAIAKWVTMFLMFDVPENDRRAMQSGKDFAKYFLMGADQGFEARDLPAMVLGGFPSNGSGRAAPAPAVTKLEFNFVIQNPIGTEDYVRDNVVPVIEEAARSFGSKIAVNTYRSAGTDLWGI